MSFLSCIWGKLCQKKGIETDEGKTKMIMNWPTTSAATVVCSFLGFTFTTGDSLRSMLKWQNHCTDLFWEKMQIKRMSTLHGP